MLHHGCSLITSSLTRLSRKFSDDRRSADSIWSQTRHLSLASMPSYQPAVSATLASILTSRYGSTTSWRQDCIDLASCSLCSTLLHDWSALVVSTTMIRQCSVICTVAVSRAHHVLSGCACLSVPTWSDTVFSVRWSSPHRGCWLTSETSIHIDGSAARSTHEYLDSWWLSFPSCQCMRLEQSTTQCHFSALFVYFQKETQNQTFISLFFALTVYMRMHVLFYMPLIYVYFLIKRLCGPPYLACIVPLPPNLAYVTLICLLTN